MPYHNKNIVLRCLYINISLFLDLFSSLYDGVPCSAAAVRGRAGRWRLRAVDPAREQQVLRASPVLDGRDRADQQKGLESFKKRPGGWRKSSGVP